MPYGLPPDPYLVDDAVLQYESTAFRVARVVHLLYFTPLLLAAIAGLVIAWRRTLEIGPLVAVVVAVTITYLVFHPSTRYRAPADPFLFILSALTLIQLLPHVIKKWRGHNQGGAL